MKLSKKDIEHVAELARLDLSDEEKERYGNQLSDILTYVNQLSEVDTDGVEPSAQVTGLQNQYREDEISVWDDEERKNAIKQAPETEDNQIKVKRVL